jgi:hypothetical protein
MACRADTGISGGCLYDRGSGGRTPPAEVTGDALARSRPLGARVPGEEAGIEHVDRKPTGDESALTEARTFLRRYRRGDCMRSGRPDDASLPIRLVSLPPPQRVDAGYRHPCFPSAKNRCSLGRRPGTRQCGAPARPAAWSVIVDARPNGGGTDRRHVQRNPGPAHRPEPDGLKPRSRHVPGRRPSAMEGSNLIFHRLAIVIPLILGSG